MCLLRALLIAAVCPAASLAATVFTVVNTADSGPGSLRQAVLDANANPGLDTIAFNIPGTGVHVITVNTALDQLTSPVLIDGYTQPGSSPNTLTVGDNAVLKIQVDFQAGPGFFLLAGSDGSTIRGLSMTATNVGTMIDVRTANNVFTGNFIGIDATGNTAHSSAGAFEISAGGNTIGGTAPAARNVITGPQTFIDVNFAANSVIQGNYFGTNAAGTAALPAAGNGISIGVSSPGCQVGGTTPGSGNVIGNWTANAIQISSDGAVVQGNFIGTDVTGTVKLNGGGLNGIEILGGMGIQIGGNVAGAGNLISGVSGPGIITAGGGVSTSTIRGNKIGTDITGTLPIPNAFSGICISSNTSTGIIGGPNPGDGNRIAFNLTQGINIGTGQPGWAILGNSISSNGGLGIALSSRCDLALDLPTLNDACDADTGSNNLQNYPILTTASSGGGSTNIQGTLNSVANTTYRIEFFSNASCDPSGFGEGQTYLGFTNVTTDGSCNASFNVTLPVTVSPQARLTATATDPAGNTSEFSACTSLQAHYFTITPCRVADTRNATGPFGGPALAANADRTFVVGGQCGIPADAQAVSFNYTITLPTAAGDLRTFPGGGSLPLVSTMNWRPGQTRANNAITPLGPSGDVVIHVDQAAGTVHFIIDVNGYLR